MPWRNGASGAAPGCSITSVCVSSISKMRSDAAIACCRLALTRLSFLAGPYIRSSVPMNERELPRRQAVVRDLAAAVDERRGHAEAAEAQHPRSIVIMRLVSHTVKHQSWEAGTDAPAL